MSAREAIHTATAPAAIGPYSQAIAAGGFVFTSGQIALDPVSGALVDAEVGGQTRQVMANLAAVLAAAGLTFGDVVKTTIFLVDMNDFAEVNAVYGESFAGEIAPARSTVAVAALPRGARVEIEAIAQSR
ncbi:reactive intermediate/imine deaminase [Vulcanimicrobium alpinum]|uniref:Reactive intermediate/imine deaminase n=1 Tax=Vulcanimicrobium alpinum TaxID=3016050 RepID=A0AAN1XY76_UNVUL|nr:Rid family detoxifying hydrolase [Vulcanimicrobium alpinum]BDE07134.1 reactive intermediate/imine deaminase [Vulcanimicrobium alpinum]